MILLCNQAFENHSKTSQKPHKLRRKTTREYFEIEAFSKHATKHRELTFSMCAACCDLSRPSAQTPIPLIAIFNVSVSVSMWTSASVCLGQDSPPAAGRPTNAAHLAQGQMTRFFCTAHKVPNELGQPRASIINKPSNHNNKSLNKFIM